MKERDGESNETDKNFQSKSNAIGEWHENACVRMCICLVSIWGNLAFVLSEQHHKLNREN